MGELDKLRSDFELAVEERKAAEARVRLVREGCGHKAQGVASSTDVESTVTGTVLTVPVKEGSSVINANSFNPGTTVAVVADMSDMIFKGRVDESEVGKLRAGMPVEIVVGALEDTKFVGTLERIAPKSQIKDGTTEFEIEAAFRPSARRGGPGRLQRQRQQRARPAAEASSPSTRACSPSRRTAASSRWRWRPPASSGARCGWACPTACGSRRSPA